MHAKLTRLDEAYENARSGLCSQLIPQSTPPEISTHILLPMRNQCRKETHTSPLEHLRLAVKHPITVLPIELLQHIFFWCLESPVKTEECRYHNIDQWLTSRSAPLLLCRVSRAWRAAALSHPALWAKLDVYISWGKPRPAVPLVARWLDRSGALPLTLALYQQNESSDNRVAAGEILDLYKRYIYRWRRIQFDLTGPKYSRLLTSQQRSAPLLEDFRMQTSYRTYEAEEKDLFSIFASVPRLAHLHVSRIPDLSLVGHSSVPVPWRQLVSLSLGYVGSVGTTLHILAQCPLLQECAVKIDTEHGPLPHDVLVHHLKVLKLNIGFENVASFFNGIACPGLVEFTVHVRGPLDQYGWPQAPFAAFLARSACRPVHFEISDTGMRFDEFAGCLCAPQMQALERIVVNDRRDWTWEPFVTDLALDLLTCSAFSGAVEAGGGVEAVREVVMGSSLAGGDLDALDDTHAIAMPSTPTSANDDHDSTDVTGTEPPAPRRNGLLPNLEALTFRGSCLWTADGAVADMVESRWRFLANGVRRLKRVELELLSSHVEDLRRLQEFSMEGLELQVLFR
ncbi:hypothetical protein D9619_002030 [Psilocybe cf. subviscida]|uniref:F-box domain-containing protein n=1 Tax=Psilocybe cf. subviscida TaxID=2480587 RepID=A0A8H5BFM3_9AGAR|nr:hypothetical protein D9619_002030 [Psilocybe cf. subviscida]